MKIDLSYLREMAGGNKELVLEMITIFKHQVVEFSEGMDQLLRNKEYDSLGKLAHKAKSSVAIMGLEELSKRLKDLELSAREGKKVDSYPRIVAAFKQETAEAVRELDQVIKNLELYF